MSSSHTNNIFPATSSDAAGNTCSECGFNLPPHTPEDLCPKCLLKAGFGNISPPNATRESIEFSRFGHYQLGRLLGKGGMGEVYEADDLKTGRRVALKILSQNLDSPEARSRFLNEGRIAATINHPNSVYVFDVEDIAGVSVISMELMPGGTLLDKIKSAGSLSFTEAVDITLQIIDGLAAAHAVGILHRDIKTSNCFVDSDGTVKIGDYGLSISKKGHERRDSDGNSFTGTPMFAPPEQLRGDDLTVRSDIYSLGVTLHTILAGKPPFFATDTIHLISKVLESPPPDLKEIRTDIPEELAGIVARCLAKNPKDRPADCDELRSAILPFSSRGKIAAQPLQKMIAGMIDLAILGIPYLVISRFISDRYDAEIELKFQAAWLFLTTVIAIAWFTLFEWKRGKTPGKALLDLEVSLKHDDPNPWKKFTKFLWRSAFFILAPIIVTFVIMPPVDSDQIRTKHVNGRIFGMNYELKEEVTIYRWNLGFLSITTWLGANLILFIGASRRNNWKSLCDMVSNSSVKRLVKEEPHRKKIGYTEYVSADQYPKAGPYHVLEAIPGCDDWKIGYDPKLLRKVWIHQLPVGTPPVSDVMRGMRRKGRLRWLAGIRSAEENWDAYEYPGGKTIMGFSQSRVPWCEMELWLNDISSELIAAKKDGSLPHSLGIDRIWITSDGHAKLLDFPAPGSQPTHKPSEQNIYFELAKNLLNSEPLSLSVISFLKQLPFNQDHEWIQTQLKQLKEIPHKISRSKRIGMAAMTTSIPALIGILTYCLYDVSILIALIMTYGALLLFVTLPAIVSAMLIGGGLIMHIFGVCLVDQYGNLATNIQAMQRSIFAWLPTLTSPAIIALLMLWFDSQTAILITLVLLAAIAFLSALLPGKSLHDRLAGTHLVPR